MALSILFSNGSVILPGKQQVFQKEIKTCNIFYQKKRNFE